MKGPPPTYTSAASIKTVLVLFQLSLYDHCWCQKIDS